MTRVARSRRARCALLCGASMVAISLAATPARAVDECGAPVAGAVTCPADPSNYPAGITYGGADDLTVTVDPGVVINNTGSGQLGGVRISNSAGAATVIAPDTAITVTSDPTGDTHYGVLAATFGADATVSAGGPIDINGGIDVFGVYAQSLDNGGNALATYTGPRITLSGGSSAGVFSTVGGAGSSTVHASGDFNITATGLAGGVFAASIDGPVSAHYHAGTITSTGDLPYGVMAGSYGAVGGSAAVTTDAGTVIIISSDQQSYAATRVRSDGTAANGVSLTANVASTIENTGVEQLPSNRSRAPIGILAQAGADAPIAVTFTGPSITTSGGGGAGILAASRTGAITITSSGAISTDGVLATGIAAYSGRELAVSDPVAATIAPTAPGDEAPGALGVTGGAIAITATGEIETAGAASHGVAAFSFDKAITVDVSDVTTTGLGSIGIVGVSEGPVAVSVNGDVLGGYAPGLTLPGDSAEVLADFPDAPLFATGVLMVSAEDATLDNSGTIGSLSDSAVVGLGPSTVDNFGTITGFVNFGSGDDTFNNLSPDSLDLRNFADTDGDLVRDTEAVAISDFGTGNDTFNNDAGGAVTLLSVAGATTIDATGAYVPAALNPALYDIRLEGVEQAHILGLETFVNSGVINMQDGQTGAAGPVTGDTLVIGAGTTAGASGGGVFVSNGGQLLIDTVLNDGGANAQSDVLVADTVALGAGATNVVIQNAGGIGARTTGDGILVVDVLDPAASAAGAFAMSSPALAGAYQYNLLQGGDVVNGGDPADGDWYLRSSLSPTTDAYAGYAGSLLRFTRQSVGTLQQRVGNRWWRGQSVTAVAAPAPPPQVVAEPTRTFTVYFDFDRSTLNADAQRVIADAAAYAKSGGEARIAVVGHTDTSGASDYNVALSERRAETVANALGELGVGAEVKGVEGRGETAPAVQTGDNVREANNRRATIEVDLTRAPAAAAPPAPRVVESVTDVAEIQDRGFWMRVAGSTGEYRGDTGRRADEDVWMLQAGYDMQLMETADSELVGGVDIHYGEGATDIATAAYGELASIDTEGMGVGGSVTWYNHGGAYVDGVVRATWFDSDIDSGLLGALANSSDGFAWAASVEGGKRAQVGAHTYVTPQAQLVYASADFDAFTDAYGANVRMDDGESLVGRLGVAFEYIDRTGAGAETRRMQGYGIANVLYEFLDEPSVAVDAETIGDDGEDFWGELGGGLTYSFNERVSLYAEALYRTPLEDVGDSHAVQGDIGLRVNW